ncbi:rRNA maturation RNase YbeY [Candidatus Berkelbacteria bacterium CG10_big_fil_rev_8_21_14_0_10_41_12]|uniref:rRNA maturation RNase YbeY n=1 Tax=Candidatus Berkelbacteria bacterium CG10_big_fil_rev_8_21_14_0_10_41_12 TaxID=1974513 RepID=A0A2M6WXK3_9BACT|nr:MAG: rRNA maturation RNase YbeY [Candidatus Berkelbacteria bacterium CG10_big_fil_rev_8_21_14_0_10_41_12]
MKIKIDIFCNLKKFNYKKYNFDKIARDYFAERGFTGNLEIELVFVGADKIKSLNRQYLKKDSSTDVLSFPLQEKIPKNFSGLIGSIIICPEMANLNISGATETLEEEIVFLFHHGLNHLVGIHH